MSAALLRSVRLASLLAALAVGGGCAGYKLGPSNGQRAGERSVSVETVANTTLEPRLGVVVGDALRKQLQQDGTYRLVTAGSGDIVVHVEIIRYNRQSISFQPSDTLTSREYSLSMSARVVATERGTGRRVLDKELSGRTSIVLASDQASAEREALPLLSADLARNITAQLVDGAW